MATSASSDDVPLLHCLHAWSEFHGWLHTRCCMLVLHVLSLCCAPKSFQHSIKQLPGPTYSADAMTPFPVHACNIMLL
eukprot:4448346-Amphidinium_carterae.1